MELSSLMYLKEPKILTYCFHGPDGDEFFASKKKLMKRINEIKKRFKISRAEVEERYEVHSAEILYSEMMLEKEKLLSAISDKFPEFKEFISEYLNKLYKSWF